MHKDQNLFPNPEKFDASRFEGEGVAPYSFVLFGGGPRMCPGHEFARLQILAFMHSMIKRFKWDLLIPDENLDMILCFLHRMDFPFGFNPANFQPNIYIFFFYL